jgi:hypothetical protein
VAAVRLALTAHHYKVTTADDGVEALGHFERERPDLICHFPRCLAPNLGLVGPIGSPSVTGCDLLRPELG